MSALDDFAKQMENMTAHAQLAMGTSDEGVRVSLESMQP